MTAQWEYTVETLGGALRGARSEELSELLNYAAEDGWEPVEVFLRSANGNQLMIVLRRPTQSPARKRTGSWP